MTSPACAACATARRPVWRSPPASTAWSALDARRLLEAGAVDVLQLDVTRCGGMTGALMFDALAWAHGVPTSLHCAPAASVHACAAMQHPSPTSSTSTTTFASRTRSSPALRSPTAGCSPTRRPGLGWRSR